MDVNDLNQTANESASTSGPEMQTEQGPSLSAATAELASNLEKDVQQLVGGVASWWSGVAQKSQATLADAQKRVNEVGIVNLARRELSLFEQQLEQAQKAAREGAKAPEALEGEGGLGLAGTGEDEGLVAGAASKGKGKATEAADSAAGTKPSPASTALPFDPDAELTRGGSVILPDSEVILSEARAVGQAATAFLSRLATEAGPRIATLQRQLAAQLPDVHPLAVPDEADKDMSTPTEGSDGTAATSARSTNTNTGISQTLSKLSATLRAQLPHLDLDVAQSQELARKYLAAGEKFANDMGTEVKGLLGDLVTMVPPEKGNFSPEKEVGTGAARESMAAGTADTQPEAAPTTLPAPATQPSDDSNAASKGQIKASPDSRRQDESDDDWE